VARLDRSSVNGINRTLRYFSIRLNPFVVAAALCAEANSQRVALTERNERWQQAVEERVAATAEITYRDEQLDTLIAALARELLVLTNGDRNHATFRKLMPTSPTLAIRSIGGDVQTRYVKTELAVLNDDPDFVSLKGFAAPIEKAQAALEQAQSRRSELGIPESRAHTDRQLAIDEARRFLGRARAQLTLLFPEDKNLVKSFFPPTSRPATGSAVDDSTSGDDPFTEADDEDSVE